MRNLGGTVEVDKPIWADALMRIWANFCTLGGKYRNMCKSRKPRMVGAGAQNKTPVVAIKERGSRKIKAKGTQPISSIIFQKMVQESVREVPRFMRIRTGDI